MRQVLKSWTQVEHDRVDAAITTLDLASLEDYIRFLRIHLHSYQKIAATCDIPQFTDLIELLRQDLVAMNIETERVALQAPDENLHTLSVSYVIGGSNFGKKILRKRWAGSDDPLVLAAGAFLTSDINRQIWMQFQSATENLVSTSEQEQHILQSARRCFEIFEQEFIALEKKNEQSAA